MNLVKEKHDVLRLLVSIDFSDCCRLALRKTLDFVTGRKVEFTLLHVIDKRFVEECARLELASPDAAKKKLFMGAKAKLNALAEEEHFTDDNAVPIVCAGVPYLEINRKADEYKADIIVIGSCGMAGNPENIFFGGTAEKVMRFTKRPVLCIPPNG